jgi:hypothetical protein
MPAFIKRNWNGYRIQLLPHDTIRNFVFIVFKHEIIPYLWGADIHFDLGIVTPEKHNIAEELSYDWECRNESRQETIRKGKGIFQFSDTMPLKKAIDGGTYRRSKTGFRKFKAISLEGISATDHYRIKMKFTDKHGISSEDMVTAEFTIKDRDDYYTQFLWLLVGGGIAIVAGVIGYILGVK